MKIQFYSILFKSRFILELHLFHSPIPNETETRDIDEKKTLAGVTAGEKEARDHGGPCFLILITQSLNFLNFLL